MSEALKITLTAVAGITVFVIGQIIQKLFIEPIQEHRRALGRVIYLLVYYQNWPHGLNFEIQKEAHLKLMDAASNLAATIRVIPFYRVLAFLKLVPDQNSIAKVNLALIALAGDVNYDSLSQYGAVILGELVKRP